MNYSSLLWRNKRLIAAIGILLVAAPGCSRRIVSTRWFGIFKTRPNQAAKAPHLPSPAPKTPDDSLRQLFAQQARGAFNPATDDRRVQMLNARLKLDPQDATARLDLAAIYERYKLYDEALEQYTRALNLQASEQAATGLARVARAGGHGADANGVLAAFVKSPAGRDSAEAWNSLGVLHDDSGERDSAERAFRRAIELQPQSDRLHNNLGYNLLLQDRLADAEAAFRRALELQPQSAAARNNLATVLARRGQLDAARREFLIAAAGNPASVAVAYNNLAVVLMEMGEYEQSRAELVRALQARNYYAPAIENFKLVQELIRKRAELNPTQTDPLEKQP